MRRAFLVVAAWLLVWGALPAVSREHVRVILDVSISMQAKDPDRLAVLATLMLHDLARPNTSLGDSFEVLPFDPNWQWNNPGDPPPRVHRAPIVAQWGQRAAFQRSLQGESYTATMTYFYPGLKVAIEDLAATPGGGYDTRAVVLVTDGLPESGTRHREAELLRDELGPLLEKHQIRLYVLAFGEVAYQNQGFFRAMVKRPGGIDVGEVFVDADGSRLLSHMLAIFGRSYGFVPDAARSLPGVNQLDLEGRSTPERVAVVVTAPRVEPPALTLLPPAAGSLNAPEGVRQAREVGASYSLAWVLSPSVGAYGFDTDVLQGSVAVLRPTRVALEVGTAQPHNQAIKTMAKTPFHLEVAVRQAGGAQGDPGPVDLSFQPFGERFEDPATGAVEHRYEGEKGAPPPGPGIVSAADRRYTIQVVFEENPEGAERIYAGHLELTARRGEAIVGERRGELSHRVEVHPFLAITPSPLSQHASSQALGRQDRACTQFALEIGAGQSLPHPDRPRYGLRAALDPVDPKSLDGEFHQATFTLDGHPLEIDQQPRPEPGRWYRGVELDRAELLKEHEICITVGKPTRGDSRKPVDLQLRMTLQESPYDDFDVIRPFTLRVRIAKPTFVEKWRSLVLLGLGLLALLAGLWFLRDKPTFPEDLCCAVARPGAGGGLVAEPLPEGALAARLLGLVVERPLVAQGENRVVGTLRPVREDLYQFRPAKGLRLVAEDAEAPAVAVGKSWNLEVHRTYGLIGAKGTYRLRLEYR